MRWIVMTLQVVLGVLFLMSAVSKLTGAQEAMRAPADRALVLGG